MLQVDSPTASIGAINTIYVSIPSTDSNCANLGLPTPPPEWSYHCVDAPNLRRIDGTGWIPVNFTTMSQGSPLSHLPIDPTNTAVSGNYYTYVVGAGWELNTIFESNKYRNDTSVAKQNLPGVFAIGTNLSLSPIYNNSGLVGYWSFDEGTGTTANDLSGLGNTGTLQPALGPTWTTGRVGGALSFDGVDDRVNVPNHTSLNITNAITIEAWVNTTLTLVDFNPTIVAKGVHAYLFTIGAYTQATPRVTGFLFINGVWRFLRGNTPINDGNWHHVVMTYNGSHLSVYRNGILDATPLAVSGSINIDLRPLNIGHYAGTNGHFRGSIDEVRIYNRALSAAEVMANFNATR